MNLLIATPLYPPDIAPPAPYVKELAKRLSTLRSKDASHKPYIRLTILTYADLPEKVPGVLILCTSKRRPLFFRIITYFFLLLRAMSTTDIVYAENGASVELPMALASLFIQKPFILHISDRAAHTHALKSFLYGRIETFARNRAKKVFTDIPLEKPEILPFSPSPTQQLADYDASWKEHVQTLQNILSEFSFAHGTV